MNDLEFSLSENRYIVRHNGGSLSVEISTDHIMLSLRNKPLFRLGTDFFAEKGLYASCTEALQFYDSIPRYSELLVLSEQIKKGIKHIDPVKNLPIQSIWAINEYQSQIIIPRTFARFYTEACNQLNYKTFDELKEMEPQAIGMVLNNVNGAQLFKSIGYYLAGSKLRQGITESGLKLPRVISVWKPGSMESHM